MQAVLLLSLFDLQGGTPAQDVSHKAAVPGVQMLHDDQGCRKVGRQVSQNPTQSSQATRRSGQGHDIESRFREDRRETRCAVSRNNCVLLWLKTCWKADVRPNAACTGTLVKLSRHVKSRGPDPPCSSDRQEHRKAGPLARSALHLDVAAVCLHQRLDDKKPESRSFLLSSGLAALVFLKKRGNLRCGYPRS